jgi:hypothetical protein
VVTERYDEATETEGSESRKLKRTVIIIGVVAALLYVFIFAFCGAMAGSAAVRIIDDITDPPSLDASIDATSSSIDDVVPQPGSTSQPLSMAEEELKAFLVSSFSDRETSLSDPTSPQSQALYWLWNETKKIKFTIIY